MKNWFKYVAGKILKQEITTLTNERDGFKQQVIESNSRCCKLNDENERLRKRIADNNKTILPNTVVAEVLRRMPDPNELVYNKNLNLRENDFKVHFKDIWSFDVRMNKFTKITDEKLELAFEVVSEDGWKQELRIPCVVANYESPTTNIRTWVWNLFESGISVVPDHLYAVIFESSKAWNKVIVELGL